MNPAALLKQEQADRDHSRHCAALAESLRIRLSIAPGYGLAALLGLSPRLSNRDALVAWVRKAEQTSSDIDFKTLSRELRRALDGALSS